MTVLRDFQHAARLYIDNAYALAPKNKFLYFVNFNLSNSARQLAPELANKYQAEINMLCKTVDLPQYNAELQVKNQYNRKKITQTKITYTPVKISMHDDNLGVTTLLLESYYKFYFRDGLHAGDPTAFRKDNVYKGDDGKTYGLESPIKEPFFENIKLFQLSRQQFTEFTLVNPVIERWGHDTMDQSDGTGIVENNLEINYESVFYSRGTIDVDNPATFATRRYDVVDSPLGGNEYSGFSVSEAWNVIGAPVDNTPTAFNPNLTTSPSGAFTPTINTLVTTATAAGGPQLSTVQNITQAAAANLPELVPGVSLSEQDTDIIATAIASGANVPSALVDAFVAQTGVNV